MWSVVVLAVLAGCANESPRQAVASVSPSSTRPEAVGPTAARVQAPESCKTRLAALSQVAELPGAPDLDEQRGAILARAKGEPVVFVREPAFSSDSSPQVRYFRGRLERARSPARALREVYAEIRNVPELARAVVLREGYLYATDPAFAEELALVVRLRHLFRAPRIIVQRGRSVRRAIRDEDGDYRYENGADAGERVSILLFDRVWVEGEDPGPPLHRTLDRALDRSGADRIRIVRMTAEGAVATLRFGERWFSAVLAHKGPELVLECESIPQEEAEAVERVRDLARLKRRVLRAQHRAIEAAVREGLPFDEPKTEEGQQDGELRREWKWAYRHDWTIYRFNEDTYRVFNADGSPRVPEVCIDFIVDTLERASGSWWMPEGSERRKTPGLDLDALGIDNRRSVERFVNFAWEHPEWFEVYDVKAGDRIPFYRKQEFFRDVQNHADRYVPGDIVTVFGPRGDENHYHSFFVYRSDPVTGMPIWVAANAGRPRIRAWATEMRSGPRRWISSRIRPRLEWLASTLAPEQVQAVRETRSKPRG